MTSPGETFVLYVAAYGILRFLVEFVRANEVAWHGLSRPQLFLLVALPVVITRVVHGARRGPYRGILRPPAPAPAAPPVTNEVAA